MATNESKLKSAIIDAIKDASLLLVKARKEIVTAEEVATAYSVAINEIDSICHERKRY